MTAPTSPPPPPPAPTPDNTRLDDTSAKQQIRELKRVQREQRKARTVSTLRNVHPAIYACAAGGVVVLGTVVLGARWWSGQQEFQRDTALALAQARGEQTTATSQPAQQPVSGIENPLDGMQLTPNAVWMIGPTADGSGLLPGRSTFVVRQILESADVCKLFIRLDEQNVPRIGKEPTAGAVPLVDCSTKTTSSTTKPPAAAPSTTVKPGE